MNTPYLISVIMPVYNAEQFLKKSIESVLGQTHADLELILVDDGSTDGSLAMCNAYAVTDNRVKVVTQKNSGPAAARNTGIALAMGAFAFFLDADDFIDVKTFEVLIASREAYPCELVMGNFCKFESNGSTIDQPATFTPDGEPFTGDVEVLNKEDIALYVRHFLRHPSNHLISYCWGRLYDMNIIKQYAISAHGDMRLFEDYVFNLEYLKHCTTVAFVNKPLYTYVMHPSHVSASMGIVNADGLLHDMGIFKTKTLEFFDHTLNGVDSSAIKKEVGHALTHYTIIFVIRSCRLVTADTKEQIRREIGKIIGAPLFNESLKYYTPAKGNSRVLPLLARLKLVDLIIVYCRYKANKRYGKIKTI
ncbi:hypothetical protein A2610_00415 [Candidatus Wolfebacteria bacterium RIFOXYD1_FULL_48_65]|uniref:Glycosyltransferase 2-like domain-containing protein n=1 Tax=Candidatus Wolfebacteria bacterium RIFOXYD1_FULL_48_65 TaxID=1802561 RepID=A0A1F8E0X7_9BACT|nr:MAG: hypothetical protein A2610_00415 [Candidatus Wolfebacteria bacterium RIFOXYD1_FULL_48_65]